MEVDKSELFGINVFKLREIVPMPSFTKPAGIKAPVMSMVNIRDQIIPVIDLPTVIKEVLERTERHEDGPLISRLHSV